MVTTLNLVPYQWCDIYFDCFFVLRAEDMVRSIQAYREMMTSDSRPLLMPDTDADEDFNWRTSFSDECLVCAWVNDFQNVFLFDCWTIYVINKVLNI